MHRSSHLRSVALTGSDQAVRTAPGIYHGLVVRETAGSTAVVVVYDNDDAASGAILDAVSLAANQAVSLVHARGLWAAEGIYVHVVSGTVAGAVRVG